jgi:hypothetical protein
MAARFGLALAPLLRRRFDAMQQMTRDLILAAALVGMAIAAGATEPPARPAAPAAVHDARDRAVRPALQTRSNLDPLRGPVATSPRAYPYDAVEMQPVHSWRGYAEN